MIVVNATKKLNLIKEKDVDATRAFQRGKNAYHRRA